MYKYLYIILHLALFFNSGLNAQTDSYIVMPATFSSRICNEFSPVFYKGGIVFCSDERDNSLVSYQNEQNRLYKIFFVSKATGGIIQKFWQKKLHLLLMTVLPHSMKKGILYTIQEIILLKIHLEISLIQQINWESIRQN